MDPNGIWQHQGIIFIKLNAVHLVLCQLIAWQIWYLHSSLPTTELNLWVRKLFPAWTKYIQIKFRSINLLSRPHNWMELPNNQMELLKSLRAAMIKLPHQCEVEWRQSLGCCNSSVFNLSGWCLRRQIKGFIPQLSPSKELTLYCGVEWRQSLGCCNSRKENVKPKDFWPAHRQFLAVI